MARLSVTSGFTLVMLILGLGASAAPAQVLHGPYIEDMTSTEVQAAVRSGATTIIIPVGGVEQSGPYIALGKHDVRAHVLAGLVARALGNALVAPVVAYVPEGSIDPPTGHMRFAGTISIPPAVFRATLEAAAKSFEAHGFKDVVLIGDHGGYQSDLRAAALDLNRAGSKGGPRAHYVGAYYDATQTAYVAALRARGYSPGEIGTHAGLADTSLMLAVDPALVRTEHLKSSPPPGPSAGVYGDPRRASAALGQIAVKEIVRQTTLAIQADLGRR